MSRSLPPEVCTATTKNIYHNRTDAAKMLRHLKREMGGYEGEVFECPECLGFHIGRKPKRGGRFPKNKRNYLKRSSR